MATAQATTDHDEIRNWVEGRGGHPARVKDTGSRNDPGVLRIDFPGFSGEDTLEEIEWDEFFEWFDRNNLAILLSDEAGNRFNKLVSRDTAVEAPARRRASSSKKKSSSRRVAKSSSTRKASSTKKASSSKKASAKKASSSKKASSRKATSKKASAKKASAKKASSTRRLASSKTRSSSRRKPSAKK